MNIKIPVSWLREYLKTDAAAKTIARELSLAGPSVERTEKRGDDYILDIEVTTNRPDVFSIYGIAREANAILSYQGYKSKLIPPQGMDLHLDPDTKEKLKLDVKVTNSILCPRFTAIILSNVKIGPSPAYIKNRLQAVGVRAINNIVDITNYIMMETGNPMHAFDFDKITGAKMTLRASRPGEKLTTLDGKNYKLPESSIVIEDKKRLIDLCGIMGGENSQITRRTKRLILFVQSYDPQTIRKTTQDLAIRTEAAARFEKGIDLENILPVLSRAVYLAKKNAGAQIASELIDIYPKKQTSKAVSLNFAKLEKYLGIKIEPARAAQILKLLGFKVQIDVTRLTAQAPSWRAQDVQDDVDLIEEIARIYGYHNLPSTLPEGQVPQRRDGILKSVVALKNSLRLLGLTEIMSYSIISKNTLKISQVNPKNAVELQNPLTEEWQFMRPSLIPSLVDVVSKNQNVKLDVRIFEIAKTYIKEKTGLPKQDLWLTVLETGQNFYKIKGLAENILQILGKTPTFQKNQSARLFQDQESATIKVEGQEVGRVGLLSQSFIAAFAIDSSLLALDLNLSIIYSLKSKTPSFHPIPKYPPQIEDISAIFAAQTPVAMIIEEIKKVSALVKNIEVTDIFESEEIGKDKKSVTLRIIYQKPTGTPKAEEVREVREKVMKALQKEFLATVRA